MHTSNDHQRNRKQTAVRTVIVTLVLLSLVVVACFYWLQGLRSFDTASTPLRLAQAVTLPSPEEQPAPSAPVTAPEAPQDVSPTTQAQTAIASETEAPEPVVVVDPWPEAFRNAAVKPYDDATVRGFLTQGDEWKWDVVQACICAKQFNPYMSKTGIMRVLNIRALTAHGSWQTAIEVYEAGGRW